MGNKFSIFLHEQFVDFTFTRSIFLFIFLLWFSSRNELLWWRFYSVLLDFKEEKFI